MKGQSKTVLNLWRTTTLGDHMHKLDTLAYYQYTSLQNLCNWKGYLSPSLIPLSKQTVPVTDKDIQGTSKYIKGQVINVLFVIYYFLLVYCNHLFSSTLSLILLSAEVRLLHCLYTVFHLNSALFSSFG